NICGAQCCPGWSQSPGSQMCTKPVCSPPCQNGGMCVQPQVCACPAGKWGPSCADSNPQAAAAGAGGVPSQSRTASLSRTAHMTLTVKHQPSVRMVPHKGQQHFLSLKPNVKTDTSHSMQSAPLSMAMQRRTSQPLLLKPKVFSHQLVSASGGRPAHPGPNALPSGHSQHAGNLSASGSMGRIKVVFTPTICKVTCTNGKCQNTCEKGNTTTLISENGEGADMLTGSGFRVVVCPIPCRNGGSCQTRDKCRCPANFTGKFCQIAVQSPRASEEQGAVAGGQGLSLTRSTFTIPVSGVHAGAATHVKISPSVANVHVRHPQAASVQVHQVSRVEGSLQTGPGHHYKRDETNPGQQVCAVVCLCANAFLICASACRFRPSCILYNCSSEIGNRNHIRAQCGKPLPGLLKQEDCCGSVGSSWGFNKCSKCPATAVQTQPGSSAMVECTQGFKRESATQCRDINECLIQGACPNADCLNTQGSYRCICKSGFTLDSTTNRCISNKALAEEKELCFHMVVEHRCQHPLPVPVSRPVCCCSVGVAWGSDCQRCPAKNSDAYVEICPAGPGLVYHRNPDPVVMETIWLHPPRPDDTVPNEAPPLPAPTTRPTPAAPPPTAHNTARHCHASKGPSTEAMTTPPQREPTIQMKENRTCHLFPGIPRLISTVAPKQVDPEVTTKKNALSIITPEEPDTGGRKLPNIWSPLCPRESDICLLRPNICGPGQCYNLDVGYTCTCHFGYQYNEQLGRCDDIDECSTVPRLCANGRCENVIGSFRCICRPGFIFDDSGAECQDINECLKVNKCIGGRCINLPGSYRCEFCDAGHVMNTRGQCEDVNECRNPNTCPTAKCVNTPGSYECVRCPSGFEGRNGHCIDVDECADGNVCSNGICANTEGSYSCTPCGTGFRLTSNGKACEDIDECQNGIVCGGGDCVNTRGSFQCECQPGYHLSSGGDQCEDINECLSESVCEPHGDCLNTDGSFYCVCHHGYKSSANGRFCKDVDECSEGQQCPGGQCVNTEGSFTCECEPGLRLNPGTHTCVDIDECAEFDSSRCGSWRCENTHGSYRCVQACDRGYRLSSTAECQDIDECLDDTVCGRNGFCENTEGSFRCLCDQGYHDLQDGQECIDVNECEMFSSVCGDDALCENVEGSFLCICQQHNKEFDTMSGKCVDRHSIVDSRAPGVETKECYVNLNDANFCDNVLAVNLTRHECCCTLGAGWGDNCEIYPCPVLGSVEFKNLCPHGKGFIPNEDIVYDTIPQDFKDADECILFGQEICKRGTCHNTEHGYKCFCKSGFYYDRQKLECLDVDECTDEWSCEGGSCVNTDGSFDCFCRPPLILDSNGKRCVNSSGLLERHEEEDAEMLMSMCWRAMGNDFMCSQLILGKETTYTECCCQYGEAWGPDCALCPERNTDDFAQLCNIPRGGDPDMRRVSGQRGTIVSDVSMHFVKHTEQITFSSGLFDSFEGLQAQECGILNGCENGRCVRVPEGYTCDCYDGYQLDLSRMVCTDVNECEELNERMSLCRNAKCMNTQGSYRCACLPGFVPSQQPNFCVKIQNERENRHKRKPNH
uniref:Latent transforming growth factor beta binding protein 1 n=1 Tax=Petromyzon marinus TaxID=7757 RepID=S4RY04_PETMA